MMAGIFPIFSEDEAFENDGFISSFFDKQLDFVQIIPEEVSDKIFLLLSAKDVLACCCVSSAWRNVINNDLHWMIRCTNNGWKPESEDPSEWPKLESHVRVGAKLQRTSPEWSLSTLASLTIKPCCSWGKRFREFLHLRWNWRNGNYVTIKLTTSEVPNSNESCSAVACHGKYLAIGTTRGMLYVWNVNGTPKLCQTVSPIRRDIEVEQIRMNNDFLALIHQYGLVRVYQFIEPTADTVLDIIIENRVWGLAVSMYEYSLFHQEMKDGQVQPTSPGSDEPMTELETMIRNLFLEDPWFDTEYDSKQMSFNLTDSHFIISGYASNCFLLWSLTTKSFVKKVKFPQGVRAGRLSFANSEILYLTGKRRRPGHLLTGTIFIYQLVDPFEFIEIPAENTSEEIRIHPSENDRLVWFSVDADVTAINVKTQEIIFSKANNSYLDNPVVSDSYIHYHLYDGGIVTLNWKGEVLYETVSHIGRLQGIMFNKDFLVSGGDNKQLTISDIHTGKKLHTLQYQPCRIHFFFVEDTKIITVSNIEVPVLFGFW